MPIQGMSLVVPNTTVSATVVMVLSFTLASPHVFDAILQLTLPPTVGVQDFASQLCPYTPLGFSPQS